MKIKKLSKILAILCTFALLCGCADNANNSSENSTEQGAGNSAPPDLTNSSDISSENSDEVSSDPSSKPEPQPVDIGNGMTLTGTLLDNSELEEFSIEPYIGSEWYEGEEEFFDSLEIPELKDLYKRAGRLFALFSTSNLKLTFAAIGDAQNPRDPAYIEIRNGGEFLGRYTEFGYTYESFYNEYLNAFTKETTEELFQEYNFFLNYYGALLCEDTASGGDVWNGGAGEVRREYELISKSDTVIEFRRIVFNVDIGTDPTIGYIPELRDEYNIDYVDFKFVLTEDGWRAANIPVKYEAKL